MLSSLFTSRSIYITLIFGVQLCKWNVLIKMGNIKIIKCMKNVWLQELCSWMVGRMTIWSISHSHQKRKRTERMNSWLLLVHGWITMSFSIVFVKTLSHSLFCSFILGTAFTSKFLDQNKDNFLYYHLNHSYSQKYCSLTGVLLKQSTKLPAVTYPPSKHLLVILSFIYSWIIKNTQGIRLK